MPQKNCENNLDQSLPQDLPALTVANLNTFDKASADSFRNAVHGIERKMSDAVRNLFDHENVFNLFDGQKKEKAEPNVPRREAKENSAPASADSSWKPGVTLPQDLADRTPSIERKSDGTTIRSWKGENDKVTWEHRSLPHGAEVLSQKIGDKLVPVKMLDAELPAGSANTRDEIEFTYSADGKCTGAKITDTETKESTEYTVGKHAPLFGKVTEITAITDPARGDGFRIMGAAGNYRDQYVSQQTVRHFVPHVYEKGQVKVVGKPCDQIQEAVLNKGRRTPDGRDDVPVGSTVITGTDAIGLGRYQGPHRNNIEVRLPGNDKGSAESRFYTNPPAGGNDKPQLIGETFKQPTKITPADLGLETTEATKNLSIEATGWFRERDGSFTIMTGKSADEEACTAKWTVDKGKVVKTGPSERE